MNKKIAVVIGASSESIYGIRLAQKMNYYVIAFDGDEHAEGLSVADEYYVTDIRIANTIIDCLSNRIPSVIIPVPIGRWLISSGEINDYYNLKGISKKSCDLCTDKYLFHTVLHEKKLRNINCELIRTGENQINKDRSYPVIMKPRYGSGSRGVRVLKSYEEYNELISAKLPFDEDIILESLVQGIEYGVDGAVINGNMNLVLLREKLLTPLPARQCVGYFSVVPNMSNRNLFNKVNEFLKKVTKSLDMDNCLFHADIIINSDEIFVIEISPRPSGHNLHNKFTILATGVNMVEEYLKFNQDGRCNFISNSIRHLLIGYFDFEDCTILKVPNDNYIIEKYPIIRYECLVKKEYMEKIYTGRELMKRGYYILEGESKEELYHYKQDLLNEFEVQYGEK